MLAGIIIILPTYSLGSGEHEQDQVSSTEQHLSVMYTVF